MTIPTPTPPRPIAQTSGLYYSFEKAGLTLDRQPIPWNAEAVLVEAIVSVVAATASRIERNRMREPSGARQIMSRLRLSVDTVAGRGKNPRHP